MIWMAVAVLYFIFMLFAWALCRASAIAERASHSFTEREEMTADNN